MVSLPISDYREAARQFQALFSLEPDKTEAWFRLGRDYTEAASRLVRQMSREHRRTGWGHRLAGDLYCETHRWALAEQEYQEGLAADPAADPAADRTARQSRSRLRGGGENGRSRYRVRC